MTDSKEALIAVGGECPICRAKDGKRCIGGDGKPLAPGRLHAGRLRVAKEKLKEV